MSDYLMDKMMMEVDADIFTLCHWPALCRMVPGIVTIGKVYTDVHRRRHRVEYGTSVNPEDHMVLWVTDEELMHNSI